MGCRHFGLSKYKEEKLPGGYSPSIVPLVLALWALGYRATNYFNAIASVWRDENGQTNVAEFKIQWRRRFSIQLQRCNESVLTRKRMMIGSGPKTLSRNIDFAQLVVK